MLRRSVLILCLLAAAAVPAARASHGPVPWEGGNAVVSPFETQAAGFASLVAGRPVQIFCNGKADWETLSRAGNFNPAEVWGYVLFTVDGSTGQAQAFDYAHLSEQACFFTDELWGAAKKAAATTRCLLGTLTTTVVEKRKRTQWRWVTKRVRVGGHLVTRRVRVKKTVLVPVRVTKKVPQYGVCRDYDEKLFGLQTLAHESIHLAGVVSEGHAECLGMQLLAVVAQHLGADAALASRMAADYYARSYRPRGAGSPYFRADCVDGSRWDVWPGNAAWPAGDARLDDAGRARLAALIAQARG